MTEQQIEARAQRATELFKQGFNCAQAVFASCADLYGITDEQVEELENEQYAPHYSAILSAIAVNRKCFKQGAEPDINRAAALLLDDFRNGKLGRISLERP